MDKLATGEATKRFPNKEILVRYFMLTQIGKQCKPVQVYSFLQNHLRMFCKNCLLGQHPPIPFEHHLAMAATRSFWAFSHCNFWTTWPEEKIQVLKNYFDAICTEVKIFVQHQSMYLLFLQLSSRIDTENWISVRPWLYIFCGIARFWVRHICERMFPSSRWLLHRTIR